MTENEIREHFEKVGYKGRSIVDIWFQNWDKIRSDLERRHPTLSQKIETHIRWKTDTGKKILAEVLTYIETKKREYQANSKLGSRDLLKLDFNEVLVDGKTINEYFYSNVKHASKYSGWVDLSGIPLRDTRISNAVICNAQLSNADFSNSVLQSITFVNCNLASCNFENAHVTMLIFKGTGGLTNSNWISASVNSIDISANQFGAFPEFTKIGYFQLINVALTGRVPYRAKYTDFSNCYLKVESKEDSAQVKSVKEYISWYQDTVNKYTYRSRNDSFLSKALRVVDNTFNAITTMNWSSLWSTVLTGCSLVILFSALFFFNKSSFVGIDSYQHSLNLSIHVFTTLGLSDIKPDLTKGNLGLWLVSAESILGYFWLALTVMVLGRNVFK